RSRAAPKRYVYEYPRPALTVDMVVLAIADHDLRVLLIRRGEPPFRGRWALPGGFVNVRDDGDQGEDVDHAAARELHEETGLRPRDVFLQQLRAFGKPGRDPRGRVVSIAYFALVPVDLLHRVRAGDDAAEARWVPVAELPEMRLAFDHDEVLDVALRTIRERLVSDLRIAASLVPAEFTKAELRHVFESVSGTAYDKSNFNKRFNRMIQDGVIALAPGRRPLSGPGRPARLYAFAS
ncbi:MAG TPA: NUDIX domain-containing protein, partial [Nannocystaceae bacterium]|nr:NUDIX domain-containing protein [Nannocystaceae bacterium]